MDDYNYDATATVFLTGKRQFTVASFGGRDHCLASLQNKITERLSNSNDLPVTIHYAFDRA